MELLLPGYWPRTYWTAGYWPTGPQYWTAVQTIVPTAAAEKDTYQAKARIRAMDATARIRAMDATARNRTYDTE